MLQYGGMAADDTGTEGRPVVLLHGLTFDRHIWAPVVQEIRALAPEQRIVALDLPGHGDSPMQEPHDFPHVVELLDKALTEVSQEDPVLVGHSMSGGLASLVAGSRPLHAVVNVDQPPEIRGFATLIQSLEPQLRGPDFADVWQLFSNSFQTHLLPSDMRALVEQGSRPSQELVLSYWSPTLSAPVEETAALVDRTVDAVGEQGTRYVLVQGSPLRPELYDRLTARLPGIEILDWSPTGHFPHLAHPRRFAELLLEVAG